MLERTNHPAYIANCDSNYLRSSVAVFGDDFDFDSHLDGHRWKIHSDDLHKLLKILEFKFGIHVQFRSHNVFKKCLTNTLNVQKSKIPNYFNGFGNTSCVEMPFTQSD